MGWKEVSVTAGKLCGSFRSPANFPAAGVSPEILPTILSGAESTVLSFGFAVVSGQPRVSAFTPHVFLLPGHCTPLLGGRGFFFSLRGLFSSGYAALPFSWSSMPL